MSDEVSRRGLLRRGAATAAAASLPAFVTSAGVASGAELEGPSGVHVAYGQDATSTARVGWSGAPAASAHVEYRPAGGGDRKPVEATPEPVPGRRLTTYHATLTDLEPGTTYEYVAVQDGSASSEFTFETAPDTGEPFSVTAVGDHGIADPNNPFQRPDTDDPNRVLAAAMDRDPAFHLGVGDISYANGHPSTWETYFGTFQEHYAETPFMTVPGNHEAEPGTGLTQYDRRLNALMPSTPEPNAESKQRWYDFRYGNAAFVGLNTTTDDCGQVGRSDEAVPIYDTRCRAGGATYDQRQDTYIRETLAQASDETDWLVVYFHGPLWTTSPDHAPREDVRRHWGEYFDEFGVDLVLSGDNHVYERTTTIRDGGPAEYGTTYVTNGTGGVSHYTIPEEPENPEVWARRTADYFGVTDLTVTGNRLELQYVAAPSEGTADGDTIGESATFQVVDEVTLVHDERGRTRQVED